MQDAQIVDLFFNRSETAITELEKKYGKLLKQLAGRYLVNSRDAEECVNDTYLAVWNSIPPNRPLGLGGYVCRILRNLAISKYHANQAQKRSLACEVSLDELEACLPSSETVEDALNAQILTDAITHFLAKLPQENRVIFIQRYWFLSDYEVIAEKAGLSIKNVSVRLTRMRKQLKRYLLEEGVIE